MKTREKEQYTEGRSGLKIPEIDTDRIWKNSTVLSFFRDLQTVNGLDTSRLSGRGETRQQRAFHNAMWIGKSGVKPLVVVQGIYEPRAREDVEYELRSNRSRQEWGQWPAATTGHEEHAMYVSPKDLEKSTALLKVEHTLTEGGSGDYTDRTCLYVNGEYKQVSEFFPTPDDYTEENQQLGRVAYSDYLKQTVVEVVGLLK